ncbi:inorganic pyrophosphatase [Thermogymnomonas acidicola]|uniref:Inorganic pyrophosphatase n=1 Tax=Thermogymnomonas acidicola TaxID=399579 RepID=A0AA37BPZ7_9ARCH|nr:inorganic diphosphatase [Thermogymnomonas acidicola]GGM66948.1 inorganic pyrophosphatase [Thermogymnomonas acidicola]
MVKNGSYWHMLPPGPKPPEEIYVVIETPRGSKNKYEVAKDHAGIVLDRVLHSSVMYPVDYGMIPQTYYLDGDPIDVLLLTSEPLFPGTIVEARPIGLMKMVDQGDVDDKVLAVAKGDPVHRNLRSYREVNEHRLKEIANFFETYKILENKKTEVKGWEDRDRALAEIERSIKMYKEKFGEDE